MRRRPQAESSSAASDQLDSRVESDNSTDDNSGPSDVRLNVRQRSSSVLLIFLALIVYSSWSVYQYQFRRLPLPLTAEQAGKRGFSEVEAMKHVVALTELGPHSVGSDALDAALKVSPT